MRCLGPYDPSWNDPCLSGSVEVVFTDTCPECEADHYDLSKDAFSVIADISIAGRRPRGGTMGRSNGECSNQIVAECAAAK